ncbi:hypothetical protein A5742_24320 [Mycolicibacterium fortuitum]|uniref:LysR family transcriptional regulator n=1 Tax=Mycolicibacterium fortuitum TaxID=1766 RepID=A0ABD6QP52_MYCFO|nr:LysR family transcriptional regulator [Mycolicibacterium fortuitum]OMC47346.1 hypothetical protein A5742_24320 [Mycolicibacterium fortuitum]
MTVRSLPLRLAPRPGEAIDSWLEALAAHNDVAWGDLIAATGVLQMHGTRRTWLHCLAADQADLLSAVTGVHPDAIHAATLAGDPEIAGDVDAMVDATAVFAPGGRVSGSRFCPACLASTSGRWQLSWRRSWTFACTTHYCLLATSCPVCQAVQRQRTHSANKVPNSGHCAAFSAPGTGTRPLCGADLTATPVLHLGRGHPAIAAQKLLTEVFAAGRATFGIYHRYPCTANDALLDIRDLGRVFLHETTHAALPNYLPEDLLTEYDFTREPQSIRRPTPSAVNAVAVTAALSILRQPSIAAAGTALHTLQALTGQPVASMLNNQTHRPSVAFDATGLSAQEPDLPAASQLRYGLGTACPRRPNTDRARVRDLVSKLPTTLWPEWSIRLTGRVCSQYMAQPALSVAVLLGDTDLPTDEALRLLGIPLTAEPIYDALAALKNCPDWPDIRKAVRRLSDHLYGHDLVIDYPRRRELDYDHLLPEAEWRQICRNTASNVLGAHVARRYLRERLTGTSSFCANPPHTTSSRSLNRFPRRLTPKLRRELLRYAAQFLTAHGIPHEPVEWRPPTHALRGLHLPGDEFDTDVLAALHQGIRHDKLSLIDAAHRFDVPVDIARHLLEAHPAPASPRRPRTRAITAPRAGPCYQRAANALPRERFADLYEQQCKTLAEIAKDVGVDPTTVANLARDYGIPIRRGGLQRVTIDREWLRDQYLTQHKPTTAIAQERGVSSALIANRLAEFGIPRHDRHAWRNPDQRWRKLPYIVDDRLPPVLVPVFSRRDGWLLLQHLAVLTEYRSFTDAAAALQLTGEAIRHRVQIIETLTGSPMFERARRGAPMSLTPAGREIVSAVHDLQHAGGPEPVSTAGYLPPGPCDLGRITADITKIPTLSAVPTVVSYDTNPTASGSREQRTYAPNTDLLLAPVLARDDGWQRLQIFADASRYRSYRQASQHLDLSIDTIKRTIKIIETKMGTAMFTRARTHIPMALTPAGSKVVAAIGRLADADGP